MLYLVDLFVDLVFLCFLVRVVLLVVNWFGFFGVGLLPDLMLFLWVGEGGFVF